MYFYSTKDVNSIPEIYRYRYRHIYVYKNYETY